MSATVAEKLYELVDLRRIIDTALVETEGELTPEIAAALDAWSEKFDAKAESIALYITDLEGDAAKIKAEEERLAARRKFIAARCAWLEKYVQSGMEATGRTKIEGVLKTVAIQKNPPSVVPVTELTQDDLRGIAAEFVTRVPETFSLNKRAILDAHKASTLPEDIRTRVLITQTTRLAIR